MKAKLSIYGIGNGAKRGKARYLKKSFNEYNTEDKNCKE
jgi:hypothetical protein